MHVVSLRRSAFRRPMIVGLAAIIGIVAVAVSGVGSEGPRPADQPGILGFDEAPGDDPAVAVGSIPRNHDLTEELAAIRGVEPSDASMLARLAAGRPPISGPIEVATVIGADVTAYSSASLNGRGEWFSNPTEFGAPRVFRVLDAQSNPDAVQISLPVKPNGQTGWVSRGLVELSTIEHQVLVNLDDDTVTVWDGDEVLVHNPAVTGTPWTPTPTGIFFLRDVIRQPDPNGAYGSYILALSGFSEALETFAGGLPAIALHGTNKPDTMGEERSNGCVRLPNDIIELLADDLPLGTPVTVIGSRSAPGFGYVTDRFGGRRVF